MSDWIMIPTELGPLDADFRRAGFVFDGETCVLGSGRHRNDRVRTLLPDGWALAPSRWNWYQTDIIDAAYSTRGHCFYYTSQEIAYCFAVLHCRYGIYQLDPAAPWNGAMVYDYQHLRAVFESPLKDGESKDHDGFHVGVCLGWIRENLPLWQDPVAYWEDEA